MLYLQIHDSNHEIIILKSYFVTWCHGNPIVIWKKGYAKKIVLKVINNNTFKCQMTDAKSAQ